MLRNPHIPKLGRVIMGLYFIYCFFILGLWLITWKPTDHPLYAVGWWMRNISWMALPTFPSSFSIRVIIESLPEWLHAWFGRHEYLSIISLWLWLTGVGYLQWFILVPKALSWFKGKPKSPASTMA